jgi:small subunit ribosomal protein S20
VKTFIKKAIKAITGGDKTEATAAMRTAESHIMKCAGKTMPKKRASRKVSRMTKKVNTIA